MMRDWLGISYWKAEFENIFLFHFIFVWKCSKFKRIVILRNKFRWIIRHFMAKTLSFTSSILNMWPFFIVVKIRPLHHLLFLLSKEPSKAPNWRTFCSVYSVVDSGTGTSSRMERYILTPNLVTLLTHHHLIL